MSNKFNINYTNGFLTGTQAGGSGASYTAGNGIDITNNIISVNTATGVEDASLTGDSTAENLTISGDLSLSKGADFTAGADAELNVYCPAEFTGEVDLSSATITFPNITLTGTSGSITAAQWTKLTASHIPYILKDNNKYYYVGRTYDTTTTTLVRTLTYYCPKVGTIVITCNDPVSPATEYTYSWAFTADTTLYVEKTYSELKTMRDNSTLVPGTYYRITDYVATTTQTNTQSANHPFDLVVFAVANNKLQENCYAIQHSGDTYFANSELLGWDIWYCLDNDTDRFEWADSTNGKGVIYYLKDEFSNSAWYDWKGIQVKNPNTTDRFYYLFDNSGADASLSSSTAFPTVYANNLGFRIASNKYSIGCNIFTGTNFYSNTIGTNFYSNTIGNNFNSNTIGNDFINNTIGTDFINNTIGTYFYYNTIGNYFYYNTIENNFNANTIGNNFINNTIGNDFDSNTIGNNFNSNTIGTNFTDNTIGTVSTNIYYYNNTFGNGIQYVDFTDYGTSSAKKQYISIPSGLVGTSSAQKTVSSLTNTTTYIIDTGTGDLKALS